MTLYTNTNGTLKEVSEKPFKLEREIQAIFEQNLNEVMSLTLVRSEFTIKNRRIDTLAYDETTKALIIIEYKRQRLQALRERDRCDVSGVRLRVQRYNERHREEILEKRKQKKEAKASEPSGDTVTNTLSIS